MTGRIATSGTRTGRSYLELEARPGGVPQARHWLRRTLTGWGLQAVADDAEAVLAELGSNAIKATISLPFDAHVGVLIAVHRERLAVLVWDASPEPPVCQPRDDDALSGRCLEIVAALSERWGHTAGDRQRGKVVYAVLAVNHSGPVREKENDQ